MSDTTGFGVIGAGTWGELHARTYASTPGARLVNRCGLRTLLALGILLAIQIPHQPNRSKSNRGEAHHVQIP